MAKMGQIHGFKKMEESALMLVAKLAIGVRLEMGYIQVHGDNTVHDTVRADVSAITVVD